MTPELTARARAVRLLVLDVDGVLTDGRLYYADDGVELKAFNIQDGLGLRMLSASGVDHRDHQRAHAQRRSSCARENLGVKHVFQGVSDKLVGLRATAHAACRSMPGPLPRWATICPICRSCAAASSRRAYPKHPRWCASHVHYVTQRGGGRGAVRELCELIMAAQGTLEARLHEYLK